MEKRKLDFVWFATLWSLWGIRNGICFRQEDWNVNNTVWNIKLLVWRWSFCGKISHPNYSFYEFCMDPFFSSLKSFGGFCFLRRVSLVASLFVVGLLLYIFTLLSKKKDKFF